MLYYTVTIYNFVLCFILSYRLVTGYSYIIILYSLQLTALITILLYPEKIVLPKPQTHGWTYFLLQPSGSGLLLPNF